MRPRYGLTLRETSPIERLLLGRVGVASLLLVVVSGTEAARDLPFPIRPFLLIIGAAYAVSFGSFVAVRREGGSARLGWVQVGIDLVLETALVYVTGGPFSVFTFVYLLSVMAASRVIAPWRSLSAAAGAVLLHGTLLTLLLYGILPPLSRPIGPRDLQFEASLSLLVVLGNMGACFIVAYVSAKLADRLRQIGQLAQQVQADLSEFKVLHEDIVESVASGLVTFDQRGRCTTANRMAGRIAGVSPRALVGREWEALFSQVPPFERLFAEFREGGGGRVRRLEGSLVPAQGPLVPVGLSLALLSRGEVPFGLVCSFQDLTHIRRMEDQVRRADRLAAVGALAASLAHEIRNPLLAVAGSIEELQRTLRPTGSDQQLMEIALKESGRLNTLLSEFLEYSRVRPVRREPVSVRGLFDELAHLLGFDPRTPPGVKISTAVRPAGLRAALDAKQMHQALLNLGVNAVEAMPEGGELQLAATVERRGMSEDAPPGAQLEIRVRDTGPGIPAEQRARVFEPFYSTKPHGFGLGLAIVHRIVEDHGGQIDVQREDGFGTTFVLTLPLAEGEWANE